MQYLKLIKKIINKRIRAIRNPFIAFYIIHFISRNNLYVEKKYMLKSLRLKLRKLKGFITFNVTSTGVLILFYEKSIIKIPLGAISENSLNDNWSSYTFLKQTKLKGFVNYRLEKKINYFSMERLLNVSLTESNFEAIINEFESVNNQTTKTQYLISAIKKTQIFKKDLKAIIELFKNKNVEGVAMHGDLTSNNIMLNNQNQLVLIDLDRFTFCGVKNYDRVHYKVDKESKRIKISFFQYLEQLITNHLNTSLGNFDLYVYFLLRISFEDNNIELGRDYYNEVIRLNTLFLKKLNS